MYMTMLLALEEPDILCTWPRHHLMSVDVGSGPGSCGFRVKVTAFTTERGQQTRLRRKWLIEQWIRDSREFWGRKIISFEEKKGQEREMIICHFVYCVLANPHVYYLCSLVHRKWLKRQKHAWRLTVGWIIKEASNCPIQIHFSLWRLKQCPKADFGTNFDRLSAFALKLVPSQGGQ